MTVFLLERLAAGRLDDAIAPLGTASLARAGGAVLLEVADADRRRAERLLAQAGVRASEAAALPLPPRALLGASGRSLVPVAWRLAHDAVVVRSVSLGPACVALLGGRWPRWRRNAERRARCRALLGGADAAYVWARQAWAPAAVLREPTVRAVLRPMVFDRAAPSLPAPSRLAYASDGALERWAFP